MKKYLIIGDVVLSADGDTHYITAWRLAELYGLSRDEIKNSTFCERRHPNTLVGIRKEEYERVLVPQSNGDYTLNK